MEWSVATEEEYKSGERLVIKHTKVMLFEIITLTVSYPSLDCKHCCFHSRRVERDERTSVRENLLPRVNASRRVFVETALFCGLETVIGSERGTRETHYVVMRTFLQIPKLRLIKALKQLKRFQADRTGEIVHFAHDFRYTKLTFMAG